MHLFWTVGKSHLNYIPETPPTFLKFRFINYTVIFEGSYQLSVSCVNNTDDTKRSFRKIFFPSGFFPLSPSLANVQVNQYSRHLLRTIFLLKSEGGNNVVDVKRLLYYFEFLILSFTHFPFFTKLFLCRNLLTVRRWRVRRKFEEVGGNYAVYTN